MLRPHDTITRETKRLDGIWSFTADASGVGRARGWWRAALPDARRMPVLNSFNEVLADPKLQDGARDRCRIHAGERRNVEDRCSLLASHTARPYAASRHHRGDP
jgi:hypothetical protein